MPSTAFLVDTNVRSELARARPNARVVAWARTVARISMSVITLEDIQFGLAWRPNPRIQAWFETFVNDGCDVRAVTSEIATIAGRLRAQLPSRAFPPTQPDLLIPPPPPLQRFPLVPTT